jgi:hypothetical protein
MIQIRNITILILFLVGNVVFAQQIQTKNFRLKWEESADYEVNSNFKVKTIIVDGHFLDDNLNPSFSEIWDVLNGEALQNFTIKNVQYERINNVAQSIVAPEKISSELKVDLNFNNERNKTKAILTLTPIVKEGNFYKKVVSFDLDYETSILQKKQSKTLSVKNSVLATGNWFKFSIDTTGVFKIDKTFLQNLGMDVNGLNPKNIQIYGNGGAMLPYKNSEFRYDGLQQNAIYVSGEEDGSFDNNDYILFYGQGPNKWFNTNNTLAGLEHQYNIFSNEAYYFITVGTSEGLRVTNQTPVESSSAYTVSNFDDYTFFELDEVNLFAVGQQWFGDSFSIQNERSYSIPFNNIDASENLIVRVRGVAESSIVTQMAVKVNNQDLFNVNFSASSGLTHASANRGSGFLSMSGNSVPVKITFNNNGNPSANAYLDYIEVLGKKQLKATGGQFGFRNFNVMNTNGVFEFVIENGSNVNAVWDVTNPLNPVNIVNQSASSTFSFKVNGGVNHEYIALNSNDYYLPKRISVSKVANQNLHSLNNLDYIIVTRNYLMDIAQKLADYHIKNSNLNVQVISLEQIYNEFASGSPDLTAIRDFARNLYTNSTTNQLKYICLFGDASYDYKDRISGNNNVVPTFEAYDSFNLATSYVTDDYYGMMDENEGSLSSNERQDVVTGRIPVTEPLQASQVVNKILNYYNSSSLGSWRNQITLVADDVDIDSDAVLEESMEKLADTIAANKPVFNLKKIYADAYVQVSTSGGNKYPTVNLDITNQVDKGTLLVDYFGHGGEGGWASEGILTVPQIQEFDNFYNLPLFVTVTCEFTRFDNPLRKTAGEYLVWNAGGGSSSLISTAREIYISVGQSFNALLIKPLLNFYNENLTIGESLVSVKNQFSTTQRFFIFDFGDPAMPLAVPQPNVRITKMNDIPVTQSLDTIKALSFVKFEGEVTNDNGEKLDNFNGEFEIIVYDKPILTKTLNNDNRNIIMYFDVLESKIFTGKSVVENGMFQFEFVASKDIKVAYGKGKLSMYATNKSLHKAGYNFDVIVGGINPDAPEDTTGPTIQLYMNDLNFVDGGNTNESPNFIAVLEDENGINTSITAVDHDIVAILDGDQNNPIILNDFYETDLNNYKKGKVTYPFKDLSVGPHTILLKVWDTYNNLSESTFSFFVVDDSDLVLTNVLNYPNPFINFTEFWFGHNKPNQLLNVQIQIFTVSGKLVKTINETIQTEGNLSRTITWNGLDDFGSKIGKGVYVYKLIVEAPGSNVKAEKIEKLVILQ